MTAPQKYVFTFYTDDPDPESIMYGCTAVTLEDAERMVRAAGYREFTLHDQRALEPHETTHAANARILDNPFLGPEWLPLVETIELLTRNLRMGKFWVLNTYGAAYGHNPYRSPYVQAMHENDGSLHVEVSGHNTEASPLTPQQHHELEFLGWDAPISAGSDPEASDSDESAQNAIPNSHRNFAPGWNARAVAEFFLETLTVIFEVTAKDFFNFGENLQEDVVRLGRLEQVNGGPIFCIPQGKTRSTSDLSAMPLSRERRTGDETADISFGRQTLQVEMLLQRIRNMTRKEAESFKKVSVKVVEAARRANRNASQFGAHDGQNEPCWESARTAALEACEEWKGWGQVPDGQDSPLIQAQGMHAIAYPAIWAAQALVVRDVLLHGPESDEVAQRLYEEMTQPWTEVMGRVHVDDVSTPTDRPAQVESSLPQSLEVETPSDRTQATITLLIPILDAGFEFVQPIAEDLLAALPGGQRVIFDAGQILELTNERLFRDIEIRVESEGVEAVADWLAADAGSGTIGILITPDQFTGPDAAPKISTLAQALSARGIASLVCAPPMTSSPSSVAAVGAVARGVGVVTVACVALDRIDPADVLRHAQTLTALKSFSGDRLWYFANRYEIEPSGRKEDAVEVVHLWDVPVHVLDFGFDQAHSSRAGFIRVRECAGLPAERSLPTDLDYATSDAIRAAHRLDGLVSPYIPAAVMDRLTTLGDRQFGTPSRPYDATRFYQFQEPLQDILQGDWSPRLQFGFDGHGLDSYAYTYLMVTDGLAVLCQTSRGLMFAHLRDTEHEWSEIRDGAQRVHQAVLDRGGIPDGKLLLVVWSEMRDLTGWVLLDRHFDTHAASPTFASGSNIADLFESAIQDGLGQLSSTNEAKSGHFAVANPVCADDEVIDDAPETHLDAQDIFTALSAAGLVDVEGNPSPDDEPELYALHEQRRCAEGKKYARSQFADDDIDGYFLEIEIWDEEDSDKCSRLVTDKYFAHDNILIALAGPRWTVILRRGDKDAAIPKDIAKQLLQAVEGSVLVWQRPIPDAEWFTSQYSLASEIIHDLRSSGILAEARDPRTAPGVNSTGDFLAESILDGSFATATVKVYINAWLTLHILIEDHWAEDNLDWLETYVPCEWKQVHVSGDGWIVRIIGDAAGRYETGLLQMAMRVQAALGGTIFKDGAQLGQ